jgi:hypothetical protein
MDIVVFGWSLLARVGLDLENGELCQTGALTSLKQ